MKILITLLLFLSLSSSYAETIKFDNHTVDIFTKSSPSPTIFYIPGCNGLDDFGKKYQKFHREEFSKVFPNANFVIVQLTNDITKVVTNGLCHWDSRVDRDTGKINDQRLKDYQSSQQAKYMVNLGNFIKQQSWSNGEIHVFGFSYGGHTGLWLNSTTVGQPDLFKSVALIWPFCKMPRRQFQFGNIHTPTRIWATEKDPLSNAGNCHNYYSGDKNLLTLTLYEGGNHSWFTHPSLTGSSTYWPVWGVQVFHKFDQMLFDKTMTDWKTWIDGL